MAQDALVKDLSISETKSLGFNSLISKQSVGAITVLNIDELQKYDSRKTVVSAIESRVPGMYGTENIRGNSVIYIVDGMERDPSILTLDQVEKIVILKDAISKVMYGSKAAKGIVLITTKRGALMTKNKITANLEYGIDIPISYPKYLNSYDYTQLYNEASVNDGLAPYYSNKQIDGYKNGDRTQYPDLDFYNSTFLRKFKNNERLSINYQGGGATTQYFLNLTGTTTNSLMKIGEGEKERTNDFRLRANVNTRITSFIKVQLDLASNYIFNHNSMANIFAHGAKTRPLSYPMFIPADQLRGTASENVLSSALIYENQILGGNQTYQENIFGNFLKKGYSNGVTRYNQFGSSLEIDMNKFVTGLVLTGGLNFDFNASQIVSQTNTYAVYEPIFTGNTLSSVIKRGMDQFTGNQNVASTLIQRRIGFYGKLEWNRIFKEHRIYANVLGNGESFNDVVGDQPNKFSNFATTLNYGFQNKYLAEFSASYTGSMYLAPSNSYGLAPAFGLAWVASKERFLSGSDFINYLKLRGTYTVINTDEEFKNYFSYQESFSSTGNGAFYYGVGAGSYSLYGVKYKNVVGSDLGFSKRKEITIGFDATILKNKVDITGNLFNYYSYNHPTNQGFEIIDFLGSIYSWKNYGKSVRRGFELGLQAHDKKGDFNYSVGANLIYSKSSILVRDEPFYSYEYTYTRDKDADAMYALVAEGLFTDQADIDTHAKQTFGIVKPGDIKYKDVNNDGKISDDDQQKIGNSQSSLYYGLNIQISYKNFDFFANITGQNGGSAYLQGYAKDYYWVGQDLKYPSYLLTDRWTPSTAASAIYPRLSTLANSNNFRTSTFWLRNSSRFDLAAIQLSYNTPKVIFGKISFLRNCKLYIRGNNLLTLSPISKILNLNIGKEPQFRYCSIGVNLGF
jgi:TonB-linked SusC/RagA family outer membrane protein